MNKVETRWPVPVKTEEGIEWAGNTTEIAKMLKAGGILYRSESSSEGRKPRRVPKQ
jgi:hypothetical protein